VTQDANALELAASFVGAARSAKEADLRAFYAAKAPLAIGAAERELEALRVNLKGIEDQLPKGSPA
jgi:hypothetical protein